MTTKKIIKYLIYSWNVKKQDWIFEAKEDTSVKAKAWAKKQSNIYNKTFKVIKEEKIATYENNKLV